MGTRIDVEWLAFRRGIKPALRLSAGPGEGAEMAARYVARGAAVVVAPRFVLSQGTVKHDLDVVYVARTTSEAEALRDAEAPHARGVVVETPVTLAATRAVGLRLGYPDCCVERCCDRFARRRAERKPNEPLCAQAYDSARDAWVAAPRWQLNDLLFAARAHVISFEPCTYACGAALAYAEAVLVEVARISPPARVALEEALRRPMAVSAQGERAIVRLTTDALVCTIASARAPLRDDGAVASALDVGFAGSLAGARVDADGFIDAGVTPRPLAIAFG